MPLALLPPVWLLLSWLLIVCDRFYNPVFLTPSALPNPLLSFSCFLLLLPCSANSLWKHHKVNVIRLPFTSSPVHQNKPLQNLPSQPPSAELEEETGRKNKGILRNKSSEVKLWGLNVKLNRLLSDLLHPGFLTYEVGMLFMPSS